MTRQLTLAVRHKLLRSPHAKRPPHGRLRSSRLVGSDLRTCYRFWSDYGPCRSNRVTSGLPTIQDLVVPGVETDVRKSRRTCTERRYKLRCFVTRRRLRTWKPRGVTLVSFKEVSYQAVENFRPLEINRMPGFRNRFEFGSRNKSRESSSSRGRGTHILRTSDE
jgi:hypothetical protein